MAKYLITTCFNCYVSPKVLPNLQFKSIVYQVSPQIHVFSCKYHKVHLIIVPPTSCFKLCNHIRFTFLIVLCFMKHPGWDHLGGSWETNIEKLKIFCFSIKDLFSIICSFHHLYFECPLLVSKMKTCKLDVILMP